VVTPGTFFEREVRQQRGFTVADKMQVLDIISKKRDGGELSEAEIEFLISKYVAEEIPDYQMAAFLMATFIRGMTRLETVALTKAMAHSGEILDLSAVPGCKVDKHSTGGVGDKVTLVVAPLVAAAGVPLAKMSGRGLGHSGGTIDKLEAIPGFQSVLSKGEFIANVERIGLALTGQRENLAPADKKIYALRDVTATVASIPLIASSIMSKKIAAGANAIVLDVKCGSGAFIPDLDGARALAKAMVDIGTDVGRHTVAVISNMDQPLGKAVGNALEVKEALMTLENKGPADVTRLSLILGGLMLFLAGKVEDPHLGEQVLKNILATGGAWQKFREFVATQGGTVRVLDNSALLPSAPFKLPVLAPATGYIAKLRADIIGRTSVALGAGRRKKDDTIDRAVGIVLEGKIGDYVQEGQLLAVVHAGNENTGREAVGQVLRAYSIVPRPVAPPPLIYEVI